LSAEERKHRRARDGVRRRIRDRLKESFLKKIILVLACLVFAGAAFAEEDHECMMMAQQQKQMDAKLQGLVDTMNKATGPAKVDAMAAVINELIAQRTAMRDQMQEMMMHHMPSEGQEHSMEDCPMMKARPSKKS